ncbi:DUF2500 domain-containing protein [Paenibacillus humicola]|uniref:DUF2500 domain-containing protein n=1 Tax=Paenibacillus humicola TaxID=3110540 RepID=UPI00237A206A|nr:DUF2500 domain-containing protein [Paenibacillus humicola]
MLSFGSPFGGPGILFTIVPIIIIIVFAIVIGGIVVNGARHLKNARSPRQTVFAHVVAKRMEVRSHTSQSSNFGDTSRSSRTYYYITLEFDSRERKEYLDVKRLYGLVVEGDAGYAAVQGDWIVGFERDA